MKPLRSMSQGVLAVVLCLALVVSGCPTAQQWFDIVGAILPIVGQTYLQFYGFAQGGTPDAADVALVQKLTSAGQDAIKQVEALVNAYKQSKDTTKLGETKAILAQLQASVDAFLTDAQIKNSTRFGDYKNFAEAILADITDLIALIPIIVPPPAGSKTGVTVIRENVSYSKAKGLKGIFEERLSKLKK